MKRARFSVTGIVQGVGFRPFLHRLARELALTGFVRNTGRGVDGEIQGSEAALLGFERALGDPARLPQLAVVLSVQLTPIPPEAGERGFRILASAQDGRQTLISPDIGICPDCLRELFDPGDRRHRYPFINCTNCGPRFTIVRGVPYDRASTTMAGFAMCEECAREYADIEDRRYHAQPDCCAVCGPRLWYADAAGGEIPGDAIAHAQALLARGGILAVKGLGGFHLACRTDEETVTRLRLRKHREEKPLALMCRDVGAARRFCRVSRAQSQMLDSPRKPIVLLEKRERGSYAWLSDNDEIGMMLPYTPVHALLLDAQGEEGQALVMTSANPSALPAVTDNGEALAQLCGIADGYLFHNRDIEARCDDSLLRLTAAGGAYFIRRSRGYAPQPVPVGFDCTGLLSMGAEQKASFALGKGKDAFCSQHIGDLKNAETLAHYQQQIARFESLFGVKAERLACDLHPDYLSSRCAEESALPVIPVQHHHAHMAACMADNMLDGACIGVVWDGTGLGRDGTIWGGEFLAGGYAHADRLASIRPVLLPGGDAATERIGRIAQSLLWDAGLPCGDALCAAMLERRVNCPPSSGMGRLFDGVYALLSGRQSITYEGQGAVLLETMANGAKDERGCFPVSFYTDGDGVRRFDTRGMIRALIAQRDAGEDGARLAMRFHQTLIAMAADVCRAIREETGLVRVVLSGGVFFNQILLNGLMAALEKDGFEVYHHRRVSTGDEGICLGQLAVAAHRDF